MRALLLGLLGSVLISAQAQRSDRPLVQFSGIVVTGDSLMPVPFASIAVKDSYRATVSDVYGYFSFVAQEGDTLDFRAIGFKQGSFVVPDSLDERKYSMIHVLYPDTLVLPTIDVYPWPSKEQFADAFMNLHLTDDDYMRALKQLSNAEIIQRMENMPPDAAMNYQYAMALNNTKLYNQGGYPSINLFNPIAWAQFVQAWKSGKFKKKK